MGERVSISFKNGDKESVTLFNRWEGRDFLRKARKYTKNLKKDFQVMETTTPLSKLDPNTVMVDFLREITKDVKRNESTLYLGIRPEDNDTSIYENFVIMLDK